MKFTPFILFSLFCAPSLFAGKEGHPMPKVDKSLSTLSERLVGTWSGESDNGERLKVNYETTSGGSALVETLSPGDEGEMVSIYTAENGKLAMTHYCMLGNQPHMRLKKSDANQYVFSFVPTSGINPKTDTYMGGLTVTFLDNKTMKQEWSHYQGGKKAGTVVFTLKKRR